MLHMARKDRKDQRRFHGVEAYNTLRQTFVLIGTTPESRATLP
jgi:hypothetical protein